MKRPFRAGSGFTLIEVIVVMAIVAILATLAVPSFHDRIVRKQLAETLDGLDFVRNAVGARHALTGSFPANNDAAGLPPADKIVSERLRAVTVTDGAVVLEFGNQADSVLRGKRLSLRPAYVDGYPQVPVVWVCASAPVPEKMTLQGADVTDVPARYLPLRCVTGAKPA